MPYKLFDPRSWFQFRGRVSRPDFWIFYLGAMAVFFLVQQSMIWAVSLAPDSITILAVAASLMIIGFCAASVGAMVRRLRDGGRKTWPVYVSMALPLVISSVFMADMATFRYALDAPTRYAPGYVPLIFALAVIWIIISILLLRGLMRPSEPIETESA